VLLAAEAWTSLEITKVVISVLTPLAVAIIGWQVTRVGKRIEQAQWSARTVIERRLELHKEMAPKLNTLLCFFTWVGNFRATTPPEAVALKRDLDGLFHTNRHLFGRDFREAYRAFITAYFDENVAAGVDARMKTSRQRLRAERGSAVAWDPTWDAAFAPEPSEPTAVKKQQETAYDRVMAAFAADLGVTAKE
jgi:hypothetical protein